jgi:hypothetical protein
MSISHAPVGPGALSHSVQGDQWYGSHQTALSNPAKFLIHETYLEEIPLPPSRVGSNTTRRESDDSGHHPLNSYSSDIKKLESSGGGWNLFGERLDSLHTSLSSVVSPQFVSASEVIDTGNVWSNRLLRGDSERKISDRTSVWDNLGLDWNERIIEDKTSECLFTKFLFTSDLIWGETSNQL